MKFNNVEVMNFEGAFRGLRNPMNSWDKSDSEFGVCEIYGDEHVDVSDTWMRKNISNLPSNDEEEREYFKEQEKIDDWLIKNGPLHIDSRTDCMVCAFLGPNDLNLAQRMIAAGSPNDKFLRQIFVSVDITAPEYWWSQFDTYKVGTVANSTSKMHKLASTPITRDCFEMDDYNTLTVFDKEPYDIDETTEECWDGIVEICETLRQRYNKTKDIKYWKELVRILPESWLQTRTVTMNYANLRGMYHWRKDHKLTEWHTFCEWVKTLPYAKDLILYKNE